MIKPTKRKKQTAAAGALLLAIMLTLSACGGDNTNEPSANAEQNNTGAGAGDNLPEESGIIDPGAAVSDDESTKDSSESDNKELPAKNAIISAEGVYTGQIDSHSIEISTDAGVSVYQIPEELTSIIENLPADAKVKFEYTEQTEGDSEYKQLWLTKIEAIQ